LDFRTKTRTYIDVILELSAQVISLRERERERGNRKTEKTTHWRTS